MDALHDEFAAQAPAAAASLARDSAAYCAAVAAAADAADPLAHVRAEFHIPRHRNAAGNEEGE